MTDDEFRRQLVGAAEEFPVRGWPADLRRRAVNRRRMRTGTALAVAVVAAAGVAVAVPTVAGWLPDRATHAAASAAPWTPVPSTAYVGSSWRLTAVAEGGKTTSIPATLDCRMDLATDGRIGVYFGGFVAGGRFATTGGGFWVRDLAMTTVGLVPGDPTRDAAWAALHTIVEGNVDSTGRHAPSPPAWNMVISADATTLVIQASVYRLTFVRIGPAVYPS